MKSLFVFGLTFITASVFAAAPKIAPCTPRTLPVLEESMLDAKKDGYRNVKIMRNTKGQALGFYAWDNKNNSTIKAEICEYVGTEEITAANEWYYWESGYKANPAAWTINGVYHIAQDEGAAFMKLLKPSSAGDVVVQMRVQGMGEEDFVMVREDVVVFSSR